MPAKYFLSTNMQSSYTRFLRENVHKLFILKRSSEDRHTFLSSNSRDRLLIVSSFNIRELLSKIRTLHWAVITVEFIKFLRGHVGVTYDHYTDLKP